MTAAVRAGMKTSSLLTLALVVSSFTAALAATPALAQEDVHLADAGATLTLADAEELASINQQSTLATAGYVTSVIVHIAGLGMLFGGSVASFCLNFSGSGCGDRSGPFALIAVGGAAAGIGLIGLFVSIGVDVGSGRRRNAWNAAHGGTASLDVQITPSENGSTFSLIGTF